MPAPPFRLTVLRARHDVAVATIPDDVCREVFDTGERSVLRYWRDTTYGNLDVDVRMYPWVDINLPRPEATREEQLSRALAAVRATDPAIDPTADTDGIVVLSLPGGPADDPFPGGATWVEKLPGAALPVRSSGHTFMCHELGHVFGFPDSWGVENSGVDWAATGATSNLYGAPHDLMSAGSFGGKSSLSGPPTWWSDPTHAIAAFAGWPNASVGNSAGPHMSGAHVDLIRPDLLEGRVADRAVSWGGAAHSVRIRATGATMGPNLLRLDLPVLWLGALARTYVELRAAQGWDSGLDATGPSLSRVGLVVYTVEDVPAKGKRLWYRGTIPVTSTDTDLQVEGQPLVITLGDYDLNDPGGPWADVTYRVGPSAQSAWLAGWTHEEIIDGQELATITTPCGDQVTQGRWRTRTKRFIDVRTSGFGGAGGPTVPPPTATWTVGGTPLIGASGTVTVSSTPTQSQVDWEIKPGDDLMLTSRMGEPVDAEVVVTVADGTATVVATTQFQARGRFEGYKPEDQTLVAKCLVEVAHRLPIGWPRLSAPDPTLGDRNVLVRWQRETHAYLDLLVRQGHARGLVDRARRLVDLQIID